MSAKKELNEKQIFVRNLPFDVTSEDLTAFFEDIGPLKHTSVASANGVGKGFGFVKFALESDANVAIEKLQGQLFHGRKIILELGLKKERMGRNKEKNATSDDAAAESEVPQTEEATAETTDKQEKKVVKAKPVPAAAPASDVHDGTVRKSRQVLIFGIPMDITKKHFRAISTRGYKKTEVDILKEDHELSAELHIVTPAGKIMLMTSPSRIEAGKVAAALNNATVHSLIVAHQSHHTLQVQQQEMINKKKAAKSKEGAKAPANAVPNNALEGLDMTKQRKEKLYARTVAQITPLDQRKRKCRLIIRNLSYLATEQNVLDKMSKFGPIVSVELPKKAAPERVDNGGKTRKFPEKDRSEPKEHSMGFGFVTFLCESDAQYVVEKVSGLKVCNREVAVDFCMSKETYEKYGKKQEDVASVGDAAAEDAAEKDASDDETSQKDDDEEQHSEGEDNDVDEGSDASIAGSEDGSDESDDDEDSENSDDEDADSDADSEKEEEEEKVVKPKKEPTEDVHEGCTVFIRGLPFDADSNDLKFALGKFGRISLALIVKDKVTDISKGSAFVKFLLPECASACVTASQVAGGLSIKDRSCKIDLAVDRQSAQSIKDSEIAKRGKDKRNMYLANEGLILPVAETAAAEEQTAAVPNKAAQNMSEADKEKRQRAQSEKRKKLQNPLFFVSGTRLSIRNLAKTVNDKELREICLNAAKNGIKKGLVKRADMEAYRAAQGNEFIQTQIQLHTKLKPNADLDAVPPAVGKSCLKNAKIMLDMQRIRGGAPQSRGYAFCEFTHHAHALAALRELNNNAAYSTHHSNSTSAAPADPNGGKLIVEFSLENIQKVKILRDREVRASNRKSAPAGEDDEAAPSTSTTARAIKRQQKTADFISNGGVEGLNKPKPAPVVVEEETAPVVAKKAGKPVKSYIVSPDTLPVVPPEGVNLKIFNKKLEKERQQKRKRENKAAADAAPAVVAEPAEKKVKVAHTPAPVAAAAPVPAKVAPQQAAHKAPATQPAQQNTVGKKRKDHSEESAPVQKPVAVAAPAVVPTPAAKKVTQNAPVAVTEKKAAAPASQPQAKKVKTESVPAVPAATAAAPAVNADKKVVSKDNKAAAGKKDFKKNDNNNNNATKASPAKGNNNNDSKQNNNNTNSKKNKGDNKPATAEGGAPVQRPWGGHKRLRAMKLKGKK